MQVECSMCKQAVDSGEVFHQEEDWRGVQFAFYCVACQEKRLVDLVEATPEQLLEWIKIGHPNEKGIPYGRFEVMDEIRRRPFEIFDKLGWPRDKDAVYKNRYTGSEITLGNKWGGDCHRDHFDSFEEWFKADAWSILEHDIPIAIWTDVDCFEEYKINTPNKLTGYMEKKEGCTQDHYNINCPKDCVHQKDCFENSVEKVRLKKNNSLSAWM